MKLFGYLMGVMDKFWWYMDALMGVTGAEPVQGWFSGVWAALKDIFTPAVVD